MARGVNDTSIFTLSAIQDTNEHDLPDTDGDDKASAENPYNVQTRDISLVKIVNEQDAELTAYLEGTTFDDEMFSEPYRYSGNSETVASGTASSPTVGAITTEDNWAYLRVVIVFSSSPTTSNDVKAVFQTDEMGR